MRIEPKVIIEEIKRIETQIFFRKLMIGCFIVSLSVAWTAVVIFIATSDKFQN
jgi:hypothetical protein